MRYRASSLAVLLFAGVVSALATAAAFALDGKVVDADGKPIENARICYIVGNAEILCSGTDEKGRYGLPDSKQDRLRVVAPEYVPRLLRAADARTPIVLEQAPTLLVKLLDATDGEPIEEGQVSIVYSSGQFKGPFPVNASGVRIRRVLPRGEARVVVVAAGYRQDRPYPIDLVPGKETEVSIELQPD